MKRLALLAFVFVILAACAQEETPTVEPPEETTATEESPGATTGDVSVEISVPEDGASVEGDVKVTVAAEGFEVVDKLNEPAVDGEGHVHFYRDVDEGDLPTEAGKPAVTADQATYHAAATTSYTWPDVDAGEHTFCVQLVNNDHTPLEPAVVDCVSVTVT